MRRLLLFLLLATWPLAAATAQARPPAVPSAKVFLDSAFAELPSVAGARYWREIEYTTGDSTAGVRRTYYLRGQLQEHLVFNYGRGRKEQVASECYDEAGRLLQRYESNQDHVENLRYYPSGQLKRRESQRYGVFGRKRKECFAPDGTRIPYFEYEIPPRYPEGDGGLAAALKAVRRNIHYPADARRERFEGRVFVAFTISETGAVENVRVVRPLLPSLDAEAIRAVYTLQRFQPGQLDGKPRKVACVAPVDFRLE